MIKIENIDYYINKNHILKDISCTINHGEMVAIIGPNGAGKSTLANIITGIYKVKNGNIYLYNKNIYDYNKKDRAKLISYVPQDYTFTVSDFTAYEYTATGRYPYLDYFGTLTHKDKEKIEYYMNLTNTYHLKERHISTLSGGERQRVSIAAALTQEAEFIILDEVSSYLDPKTKYDINNLLIKLNQENKYTIIMVTHDLNYALSANSNFLCLKNGSLLCYKSTKEMVENQIFNTLFNMEFTYINYENKEIIIPK